MLNDTDTRLHCMGLSDNGYHLMSYAYSYQTNSVSKWDTIQSDVADAYRHLDDVEEIEQEDEEDFFGFAKSIQLDHLTDEELDNVATMLGIK